MNKLLTSNWTAAICGMVLYLVATVAFWKPPVMPPPSAALEQLAPSHNGPSWDFTNPEADQLLGELKAEKEAVKKREQMLNDLAARLDSERTEVNQATQSVHQLQLDFDKNVVRVKDEETSNLKKLAKVYSEMTPEGAAKIFTEMDDHAVTRIMVFMKDGETAAILEAMSKNGVTDAKRVAALSDNLRLSIFRKPTAQ